MNEKEKFVVDDGEVVSGSERPGDTPNPESARDNGLPPDFDFDLAESEELFDINSNLFQPTVKIPFQHPTDPDKKIVFFGMFYDDGHGLITHSTSVIDTLLRYRKLAELTKSKAKELTETDIAELFDEDRNIQDMRNSDFHKLLIVSYCTLRPAMLPSEIIKALPKAWWQKLYEVYTEGVSGGKIDPIDRFSDQNEAEREGDSAERSPGIPETRGD